MGSIAMSRSVVYLKVKGPDILYTSAYRETRTAAVYNA